jgi:uridine kinase
MKKPYIIAITGASGSGKTTFLEQLRKAFPADSVELLSQDNYYRHRDEQQPDENGILNFDLPASLHLDEFLADVQQLCAGKEVKRKEYTFNNELIQAKNLIFYPRPIIILEGLFVMHDPALEALIDLKVFLYAPETTAFSRRIRRDKIERNYPLEDVLYRYEKHVIPSYEKYIRPLHQKADIVVNNQPNFDRGLAVLVGFLKEVVSSKK